MKQKTAVVIPCYKVKDHIANVISGIPEHIEKIYCIDDACPENSGQFITDNLKDKRVHVITHDVNQGVGGAVVSGYRQAIADGYDIAVKVDGDGQMDPALIHVFVKPLEDGACDYAKGNRFFYIGFHARNTKRIPYNVDCVVGQNTDSIEGNDGFLYYDDIDPRLLATKR